MLMTSFAIMLLWFYVVGLQLNSAVNDTVHTLLQNLTDQSTIKLVNLYEENLFGYYLLQSSQEQKNKA